MAERYGGYTLLEQIGVGVREVVVQRVAGLGQIGQSQEIRGRKVHQEQADPLGMQGLEGLVGRLVRADAGKLQGEFLTREPAGRVVVANSLAGALQAGVVDGRNVQDNAMSAAENLMTANPDLSAIYATGEPALLGAVAAVESQGRQDVRQPRQLPAVLHRGRPRAFLAEVEDANFVRVRDGSETVSVSKKDGFLHVDVDDTGRGERVRVRMPLSIVDAMITTDGQPNSLDLTAALRALSTFEGDLVTVQDGRETVRVWIDSSNSIDE